MNNRMDQRKKSIIEIEKKTKWRIETKLKKSPNKTKWIIGWTKEKSPVSKKKKPVDKKDPVWKEEKDNPEVKKRIWGERKPHSNKVNNRMDKRKKCSIEKEKASQ